MNLSGKLDRRQFISLTTALLATTTFAACGGSSGRVDNEVTLWAAGESGNIKSWDQNAILKKLEAETGADIKVSLFGFDAYEDRLNATMASGQPPDIIGSTSEVLVRQWAKDGIVAPFEDEIAEVAPNILKDYEKHKIYQELKIDGKIYMVPIHWDEGIHPNISLVHVRQDLLDKYGMSTPDTIEQYIEFLRAAKKDGSTGLIFSAKPFGPGVFNTFLGAYNLPFRGWVKTSKGFEYWAIQPQVKDALLLFRKIVAEGLVDEASWSIDDARDKYAAGQGCSLIFNGGGHIGRIQHDMNLVGKGFKNYLLPALDGGQGSRGYTGEPSFYGVTALGNQDNNHRVEAARVLNYLKSEAGYKLTVLGVEGTDYKEAGEQITFVPEQRTQSGFPSEQGDTGAHPLATNIVTWVPMQWQDFMLLQGKDESFKTWYQQMRANQEKYQIQSYGLLLTTPAWTDFSPTGGELVNNSFLQIIRAKSEQEASKAFDQFVSDWKKNGGDEATPEMSTELARIYS